MIPGTDINLQWVLDVLNRRKWLGVAVFLCTLTAGIGIVKWLPDIYYASATVLIEHQQIPTQLIQSTVTSSPENRLQTIGEQILSRSRLEELIHRFDLYADSRDTAPMDKLVARMRNSIWVDLKRDQQQLRTRQTTVAFNVIFQDDNPTRAADVTNALASLYVSANAEARERQAQDIAHFLATQVEEVKKTLDDQESQLSRFKMRHVGELPHQQDANLKTLDSLNTELQQNLNNQVQASERRASLQQRLAEATAGLAPNGPDDAAARLAEMKQRLGQLRTAYSDRYPDVVRLQEEIAALEASQGDSLPETASDTQVSPLVADLKQAIRNEDERLRVLELETQGLRSSIENYRRRVDNAPRVEQEYQLLSRDYDTTMELYRSLLNRQKEAELAENMESGQKGEQFRVIEWAVAPNRPSAPNRPLLWMMSFVLAIGLGVGAMVLLEYIDGSFHSVDELRTFTDVRLLGSIPLIMTPADRSRRKWRFALGVAALGLGLVAIAVGSYLFADGNSALTARLSL